MRAHALWIQLLLTTAITTAQSPSSPDVAGQLEPFLLQLQRSMQSDDRNAVAAMIRYPITISIGGGLRVPVADAASFLSRYDDIFNPPLRDSIERATVRPQPARTQVTVAPDRFVIGSNHVVITSIDGALRITGIVVPEFVESGVTSTAQPTDVLRRNARPQEPRRIAIRVGSRPTQIPGLLARDATDIFILYLPKGQLAGVRLERVPPGAAAIRVVHARTGAPLAARTSADGRFVSGRPSEGAEYRIEVRRGATDDAAPLPYMLSLTLR